MTHWLVVGLGNPGPKYVATRHNFGWMFVDQLASQLRDGGSWEVGEWSADSKAETDVLEARSTELTLTLAKPTTYMNNSGRSVARLLRYSNLSAEQLVVAHDELDVPLGVVRIRLGGSAAGHNGVASVSHHLGSDRFWRLRLGIAPSVKPVDATSFVLAPFMLDERQLMADVLDQGARHLLDSVVHDRLAETTLHCVSNQ